MRDLLSRAVLIACMLLPIAACAKPAPQTSGPGTSPPNDGNLAVAVVDSPVRQGKAWRCFDVAASAEGTEAANDVVHGEQVVSAVLRLETDPCPGWADHVALHTYAVGAAGAPTHTEVAEAIRSAAEDGAVLINVSIAFRRDFHDVREAAAAAREEGAVIVAAAGNHAGLAAGYPARYDGVISVGAASDNGTISPFSAARHLDVVAPGENIAVVDADGKTAKESGTSLAAAVYSSRILDLMLTGQSARDAAQDLTPTHQQEERKEQ